MSQRKVSKIEKPFHIIYLCLIVIPLIINLIFILFTNANRYKLYDESTNRYIFDEGYAIKTITEEFKRKIDKLYPYIDYFYGFLFLFLIIYFIWIR
jgi:hypothetical protein